MVLGQVCWAGQLRLQTQQAPLALQPFLRQWLPEGMLLLRREAARRIPLRIC